MQVSMTPERARVPLIKLTHAEERPFRDGLSFLAMTASLWSNILYSELQLVFTNHPAIPIAATDAHRVYFNPAGVARAKFTIENLCFVYAHEVMHYIRGDLIMAAYWNDVGVVTLADGKTIPYHHDLMNCAMDFVINGGLKSAMIGDMPACALYDETLSAKGMESSIDVYVILYKRAKQQQTAGARHGTGHARWRASRDRPGSTSTCAPRTRCCMTRSTATARRSANWRLPPPSRPRSNRARCPASCSASSARS